VIGLGRKVRVFAWAAPVDQRKSFWTLSALVASAGHAIVAGDAFVFVGRCRRRAKVLWFDGTGLVLLAKVLETGRFAPLWERAHDGIASLTTSELAVFLEGSREVGRASLVCPTFDGDRVR
jgi:transposase